MKKPNAERVKLEQEDKYLMGWLADEAKNICKMELINVTQLASNIYDCHLRKGGIQYNIRLIKWKKATP